MALKAELLGTYLPSALPSRFFIWAMDLLKFQCSKIKLRKPTMANIKPPKKPYSHPSLRGIQNSGKCPTDANQIEFAHIPIPYRANNNSTITIASRTVLLVTGISPLSLYAIIILYHVSEVLS
jgi:hypothetical protein